MSKDKDKTKEANKARKQNAELRRKLKALLVTGDLSDLQQTTVENWAQALISEDEKVRREATRDVSKFLFATKRETTSLPKIEIRCTFRGIKDNKSQEVDTVLDKLLAKYNSNILIKKLKELI